MGGSKVFLFLGLLQAIVFISSEVAARNLAQASSEQENGGIKESNIVVIPENLDPYGPQPQPYFPKPSPSPRCLYGCCQVYGRYECVCCRHAGQALEARQPQSKPHN